MQRSVSLFNISIMPLRLEALNATASSVSIYRVYLVHTFSSMSFKVIHYRDLNQRRRVLLKTSITGTFSPSRILLREKKFLGNCLILGSFFPRGKKWTGGKSAC